MNNHSPDILLDVKGVSMVYEVYAHPSDRLKELLLFGKKSFHHDYPALSDVSLQLHKGQMLGIIGENGSGKSTLLQVMVGVLLPTQGEVRRYGRIASLLELGTGFNPEFTGRQNIYIHGSLLGLSRDEIDAKMCGVEEFADIGEFIDQPVKTYSSGMYVRLAFAASIHVNADILIVDEALAVGDLRFQQKCLRKIEELKNEGKTIILVTHDTGTARNFCDRIVWLHKGSVCMEGEPSTVIKRYIAYMQQGIFHDEEEEMVEKSVNAFVEWTDVSACASYGEGGAKIEKVALFEKDSRKPLRHVEGGERVIFEVFVRCIENIYSPICGFLLNDRYGNHLFGINNILYDITIEDMKKGDTVTVAFEFTFPHIMLGTYTFSPAFAEGTQQNHVQHHWVHDAYIIDVVGSDARKNGGFYFALDNIGMHIDKH